MAIFVIFAEFHVNSFIALTIYSFFTLLLIILFLGKRYIITSSFDYLYSERKKKLSQNDFIHVESKKMELSKIK